MIRRIAPALLLLAVCVLSACAQATIDLQRSAAEFTPITAAESSMLAGCYRDRSASSATQPTAGPAAEEPVTLWDYLNGQCESRNCCGQGDVVQIEMLPDHRVRFRRIAPDGKIGDPQESDGHFADGYFTIRRSSWYLAFFPPGIWGSSDRQCRLGLDAHGNLLVDYRTQDLDYWCPIPFSVAAKAARTSVFSRVDPAATQPAPQPGGVVHFTDLPGIARVEYTSRFFGPKSGVDRPLTDGEEAYNYSVDIIRDGGRYRMYCGGRWRRPGVGDGDHVMQYVSDAPERGPWVMPGDRPEFGQGQEEGHPGTWFAGNYLEPEVLKVGGTYYMYTQVEIDPGQPLDGAGGKAVTQADRIQLHTSGDGSTWQRWSTQRGVVTNLEKPERTNLHHQEMLYVPWDSDGRPFWMYVGADIAGQWTGYYRIRSADPTTFDWQRREEGVGFAQLGNQLAYAKQAPGGPLFVRITFTDDGTGRQVPSLQFSRDGLHWPFGSDGPAKLAGSADPGPNRNCYFLGLSTLDGTGELEYLGAGRFRAIYGATTCDSPGAPEIFHSAVGVGELRLSIGGGP